jgi:hypothetical protein
MIMTTGGRRSFASIDSGNAKSGSLSDNGRRVAVIREERLHMPGATELPQMVTEFVDMSKEYLRQETLEPAKRLGKFAGFTIGASIAFAIGGVLLAIAGMRGISYLLPEGPNWTALGYILGALAIGVVIAVMVGVAGSDSDSKEA